MERITDGTSEEFDQAEGKLLDMMLHDRGQLVKTIVGENLSTGQVVVLVATIAGFVLWRAIDKRCSVECTFRDMKLGLYPASD